IGSTASCAGDPSLDCTATAIMKAFIPNGINATLQTWDHSAAALIYPPIAPPAAPTNLVATATSSTSVGLTWTASAGASNYVIARSSATNFASFTDIATVVAVTSTSDSTATANSAYLYKIRASNGSLSGYSNADLATTVIFTDPSPTQFVSTARGV